MPKPQPTAVGVDVQTNFIALTMLHPKGYAELVVEIPKAAQRPGAQRLVVWQKLLRADERLRAFARGRRPHCVVVELPIGTFPKPQSLLVCGVVMAGLQQRWPCPVVEAGPTQWKKALGLKGNAGKPECMAAAIALGYQPVPGKFVQDLADSHLLATYARKLAS